MAILNYTTEVAAEKTVAQIQSLLAKAGAQAIMSEYDSEGVLCAMSFRLVTPQGPISFTLPSNIDRILECLKRDRKVPGRLKTKEQASRVAWRILLNWIEAQVAIVQAQCAELPQVFLPYAKMKGGETLYDQMKDDGFLRLTGPKS